MVGCGQPGRSDGLEPCSASRRGVLYPRGTATTQDQYTKLTWAKTRSFCDDSTFFYLFNDFCQHIDVSNRACGGVWQSNSQECRKKTLCPGSWWYSFCCFLVVWTSGICKFRWVFAKNLDPAFLCLTGLLSLHLLFAWASQFCGF